MNEVHDTYLPAVIETPAPITLYGTFDPTVIIAKATAQAQALAKIIETKHLYKWIGKKEPKKHVLVEGWTLLGTMLGVFPVTVWSRPVPGGWEARVEARTLSGAVVGAAEAQCLDSEDNWSDRDDFALRSMAQTRAASKALRLPLGFVMTLAGYDATPAEEMDAIRDRVPQQPQRAQSVSKPQAEKSSQLKSESTDMACPRCSAKLARIMREDGAVVYAHNNAPEGGSHTFTAAEIEGAPDAIEGEVAEVGDA